MEYKFEVCNVQNLSAIMHDCINLVTKVSTGCDSDNSRSGVVCTVLTRAKL